MDIEALRRTANQELARRGQPGLNRFRGHQSRSPHPPTPHPGSPPQAPRAGAPRSGASPGFLWSLLVPGLGQFLQGRWAVGFGFLAAAWLGWTLGPGWVVHLAAAAEAAWHEYV